MSKELKKAKGISWMSVSRIRHRTSSIQAGFTLIELMVVITILALLGGVVMPRVIGRLRQAKPQKAAIDINQTALGLDMYAADNGEYPTTEQGLEALIREPTSPPEPMNWSGPYVKPTNFLDPWGNKYIYESPSSHEGYDYDLYSYGADGQEGGTDEEADITSWLQEDEY